VFALHSRWLVFLPGLRWAASLANVSSLSTEASFNLGGGVYKVLAGDLEA
jgi:hypothetical protein